ncbi:MAG: hypothetical protein JNL98_14575 [Bryobacterales bacterium]|nr:hypothetical protein [Bryobacterales bacterium]
MQITRFLSVNHDQFLGCASAFTDTLSGELGSAVMYLRKLDGKMKGSAFAFEMQLDKHRYGAIIVLDRWAEFGRAFAPHTKLDLHGDLLQQAEERATAAQRVIEKVNHVIDSAEMYTTDIVEAVQMAYQAIESTFQEERAAAVKMAALGPMIPEEFKEYRKVFLSDLSVR